MGVKVITPLGGSSSSDGYAGVGRGNTLCDDVSLFHLATPENLGENG
jgi:hypothetical protein